MLCRLPAFHPHRMQRLFTPLRGFGLAWLLALSLPAWPQPLSLELDVESWRAASRLDTAEAYRTYLNQFPNGAFVPYAQQALQKLSGKATSPVAAPPRPAEPAALATVQTALDTNIVNLRVGDRLHGPGVLTVGSFGSRRHVLLPRGEWVVLAGFDHKSSNQVPVPLVTLAFGQFSGAELQSMLAVTFTRRAVAPAGGAGASLVAIGMLPRWIAAEQCEAASPAHLHHAVVAGRQVKHCASLRRALGSDASGPDAAGLQEATAAALALLKGRALPPAWRVEVHITDSRLGYLAYTRLDTGGTAEGQAEWLKAFAPLAASAYNRELELDELQPGQPASSAALALPL